MALVSITGQPQRLSTLLTKNKARKTPQYEDRILVITSGKLSEYHDCFDHDCKSNDFLLELSWLLNQCTYFL